MTSYRARVIAHLGHDPFKQADYDYPDELGQSIDHRRLEAEGWRYEPSTLPDNPTPKQTRAAERRLKEFRKALLAVHDKKLALLLKHFGIERHQRLRWEHRWWLLSYELARRYVPGFRYGPPLPKKGAPSKWSPETLLELEALANEVRRENPGIRKTDALRFANKRLKLGNFETVRRRLNKFRKDEPGGK